MTKPTFATDSSQGLARRSARGCLLLAILAVFGMLGGCKAMNLGGGGPEGLDGSWTVTLNPETVPIEVPLTLNSDSNGALTGAMGAASLDGGKYSGEKDGSTIEFQTGAITVEGPTGEITREGPLSWSAKLRGGALEGTVTDSEGRSSRWTARRDASSSAAPSKGRNSCEIRRSSVASAQ